MLQSHHGTPLQVTKAAALLKCFRLAVQPASACTRGLQHAWQHIRLPQGGGHLERGRLALQAAQLRQRALPRLQALHAAAQPRQLSVLVRQQRLCWHSACHLPCCTMHHGWLPLPMRRYWVLSPPPAVHAQETS
jgi:hypothetical protein